MPGYSVVFAKTLLSVHTAELCIAEYVNRSLYEADAKLTRRLRTSTYLDLIAQRMAIVILQLNGQ